MRESCRHLHQCVSVIVLIMMALILLLSLCCLSGKVDRSWRIMLIALSLLSVISLGLLVQFKSVWKSSICINDALVVLLFLIIFVNILRGSFYSKPLISIVLPIIAFALYWNLRVLFSVIGKDAEKLLVFVIAILSVEEALFGLLQGLGVFHSNHILFPITGHFHNPGPYGCFIAVTGASSLVYVGLNIQNWRDFGVREKILISLSLISAFLTMTILPIIMSRAAILGFLCGTGLFLAVRYKLLQSVLIRAVLIIVIASFAIVLYNVKKDSADGRLLIYKVAINALAETNGLGCGLGAFEAHYGKAQYEYFVSGGGGDNEIRLASCPKYAFNDYLQLGVEVGILPMIILIIILVLAIYRLTVSYSVLAPSAIALCVSAMFAYPLQILPIILISVIVFAYSACVSPRLWQSSNALLFTVFPSFCALLLLFKPINENIRAREVLQFAHALYSVGAYESAVDKYASIAQCKFLPIEYYYEYGHALHRLEKWEESNKFLKMGSGRSNDPMFHNIMGKNFQAMGMVAEAEKEYTFAHYLVPNRLYPIYLLAMLYHDSGQKEKFDAKAKEVMNFNPKVSSQITENLKEQIQFIIEQQKRL